MSVYIRGGEALVARAAALVGAVEHEPHCEFLRAPHATMPARAQLEGWSRELATDVLWMSAQPAVDAFEYLHYRLGAVIRVLVYGANVERVWESIEGSAQPWETWRRPPKLGSMNFSFHGDPAAEVVRHYRLAGMGVPVERQPAPKKRPQAKPYKIEKRKKR